MRGLRLKIALILVVAVVAVVLVATVITALFIGGGESERLVGPVARHITMTSDIIARGADHAPPPDMFPGAPPPEKQGRPREIVEAPPEGVVQAELTASLQRALAREGERREVVVTDPRDGDRLAALRLDDGRWMLFPFPRVGLPPQVLFALGAWLVLVVIGVVAVALVMAQRVTRPFAILEHAVASVRPDGVLPYTPETGSGEARQTAVALNALSDRLKAAMESRMRLVAVAGHDLRTPMTRMRLRAEFLPDEDRQGWLDDLDELDAIADSAIRLLREEGAGEDHGTVELDRLLADTVAELDQSGLPVTLQSIVPAQVTAGPLALRRALRNLITNAATHGGGARVALAAGAGDVRVEIEDDGPGIPEALLSQVFEPFFRANPARTQTTKGVGLGLAIAREIVERFGGTIEISNRPEGGLRQVLSLRRTVG